MVKKLTRAQLLKEIDGKLASLNLLRSALSVDKDRTQAKLLEYEKNFRTVIGKQ